jgi:Ca2+/Na+ antiporter
MQPIAYLPAYAGLGLSMLLALACNAFLDIRYGAFATEMFAWSAVAAVPLVMGWRHRDRPEADSRSWQTAIAGLGVFLFFVVFMPIWGLPRAGVYLLAFLQAAVHVSLTRRNFYFSALIALVLVLFAASHSRADWTLLFYVVPFVIVLLFTVTAEQVSRRAAAVQAVSLARGALSGQWLAVGAAAALVFMVAAAFYAVTPQASPMRLFWEHGLPSNDVRLGGESGQAGSGAGRPGEGSGTDAPLRDHSPGMGWPSPAEMRQAAGRPGMPGWQAQTIRGLADLSEALSAMGESLAEHLQDLVERLNKAFPEWREDLLRLLFAAILAALAVAAWLLAREVRPALWVKTRFDYLHYVVLGRVAPGRAGIRDIYAATARLFGYYGNPRLPHCNSREYFSRLVAFHPELRRELVVITAGFEAARYGMPEPGEAERRSVRQAYRTVFQRLADQG